MSSGDAKKHTDHTRWFLPTQSPVIYLSRDQKQLHVFQGEITTVKAHNSITRLYWRLAWVVYHRIFVGRLRLHIKKTRLFSAHSVSKTIENLFKLGEGDEKYTASTLEVQHLGQKPVDLFGGKTKLLPCFKKSSEVYHGDPESCQSSLENGQMTHGGPRMQL